MSRPAAPIVCDGPGCGKQKQTTNRWWQIVLQDTIKNGGRFRLCLYDADEPIVDADWAGWTWYDFCGQTCALKFISEQMSKVTS
jgi:hypothetical protein